MEKVIVVPLYDMRDKINSLKKYSNKKGTIMRSLLIFIFISTMLTAHSQEFDVSRIENGIYVSVSGQQATDHITPHHGSALIQLNRSNRLDRSGIIFNLNYHYSSATQLLNNWFLGLRSGSNDFVVKSSSKLTPSILLERDTYSRVSINTDIFKAGLSVFGLKNGFQVEAESGYGIQALSKVGHGLEVKTQSNKHFSILSDGEVMSTGFFLPADASFMTNTNPLRDATEMIKGLQAISFEYVDDTDLNLPGGIRYGLTTDEMTASFESHIKESNFITYDEEGVENATTSFMAVNYVELVPVLVATIKELNQRIDELEARIQ